jgi:glycogen operon protein
MIVMGDEVRRTQYGNNNAYCLDDETNWFDWTLLDRYPDVHRFVKLLLERRLLRSVEHERRRTSLVELLAGANKAWHGVKLNAPDWGDNSHALALGAELRSENMFFHFILNGYWEPLEFELPAPTAAGHGPWRRWFDTALPSPDDIAAWQSAPLHDASIYRAAPRSVVMLIADGPRSVTLT